MSHTTAIKGIKIQDINTLRAALAELNTSGIKCSLVANATPRAYYPNQQGLGLADFVIKLDQSAYDVGLYKQEDGSYEPRTDFWQHCRDGLKPVDKVLGATASKKENEVQAKLGKLFQMYGLHAATQQARQKGYTVRRVAGENGAVKLVVGGFA